MARLRGTVTTEGEVALSSATAKTILQIEAPTNHRVALTAFSVSFDATSAGLEPVNVEILRQTTAGTMTSATPVKDDSSLTESIQTSAQRDATSEPTAADVLRRYNIHPQDGYERVFGPDEEIIVPGGGRLAIRCTSANDVNVTGHMSFEE